MVSRKLIDEASAFEAGLREDESGEDFVEAPDPTRLMRFLIAAG
jgi:hypothetical protein